MGRRECNNVDRRDGRSEGNSTMRRLRRRLWKPGRADGEWANQRAGCQPSTLTSTVVPFRGGLTALARSGEHLCHQHLCESRAQGLVSWHGGGASKKYQQLPPQQRQPASSSNLHSKSWEIDGSLNQICHSQLSPRL